MATKTVTTEYARVQLRNLLDDALTGEEIVIERYGKPVAAVVNFNQYNRWQGMAAELARLRRIIEADHQFAAMDAGDVVEFDYSQAPAA